MLFHYGLATPEEIVRWADSQMLAMDSPPDSLIELSATPASQPGGIITHLNGLAGSPDFWDWDGFRAILARLHDDLASHPSDAGQVAAELYQFIIRFAPGHIPSEFYPFYAFDDEFALASMASMASMVSKEAYAEVSRDFIRELAKYAQTA